jgi:hypothetical protein
MLNQDDFKVEAYGTVTPPPEPADEPNEGDDEEKDDD